MELIYMKKGRIENIGKILGSEELLKFFLHRHQFFQIYWDDSRHRDQRREMPNSSVCSCKLINFLKYHF